MIIRKACPADLPGVDLIYNEIHAAEEAGLITIGWKRGVYPVRGTAEAALERDDLYIMEVNLVLLEKYLQEDFCYD